MDLYLRLMKRDEADSYTASEQAALRSFLEASPGVQEVKSFTTLDLMCTCSSLASCFGEIHYWDRRFSFAGESLAPAYFETPDTSDFTPPLTHKVALYRCSDCGQHWYIECLPEEPAEPEFGLKVAALAPPSPNEVRAAKDGLCVIAHGGFDVDGCVQAACPNRRLRGRMVCHLHLKFP